MNSGRYVDVPQFLIVPIKAHYTRPRLRARKRKSRAGHKVLTKLRLIHTSCRLLSRWSLRRSRLREFLMPKRLTLCQMWNLKVRSRVQVRTRKDYPPPTAVPHPDRSEHSEPTETEPAADPMRPNTPVVTRVKVPKISLPQVRGSLLGLFQLSCALTSPRLTNLGICDLYLKVVRMSP